MVGEDKWDWKYEGEGSNPRPQEKGVDVDGTIGIVKPVLTID